MAHFSAKRLVRIFFLLVALGFMAGAMIHQWDAIARVDWTLRKDLLAIACFGILALFILDAFGWHLTLRALGQQIHVRDSVRIWLVSSLARYIPGGIWAYAGRIALAKEVGIGTAPASLSLYLETLLLMGSSLAIGFPSLLAATRLPISPLSASLMCLAFGLLLHPGVVALLGKLPGKMGHAIRQVPLPSPKAMLLLYGYYLLFWAVFGLVFDCFVAALHPLPAEAWIPVGSSLALGFFVGFVVIVAPGGLGVRESAMYLLLLPFLSPPASLLVSVGSRIWIMFGEFASLVLILAYERVRRPVS